MSYYARSVDRDYLLLQEFSFPKVSNFIMYAHDDLPPFFWFWYNQTFEHQTVITLVVVLNTFANP
jgi:hypothetical protein